MKDKEKDKGKDSDKDKDKDNARENVKNNEIGIGKKMIINAITNKDKIVIEEITTILKHI
jgi:hypothetical protein